VGALLIAHEPVQFFILQRARRSGLAVLLRIEGFSAALRGRKPTIRRT